MRVVVDANILVAALLKPDGWTARELGRDDIAWVAPAVILEEVETHEAEVADKAGISVETLEHRLSQFLEGIDLIPQEALVEAASSQTVQRALEVDPKDALYLACVEASGAWLLWTRDKGLLDAFEGLAVRVVPRGGSV